MSHITQEQAIQLAKSIGIEFSNDDVLEDSQHESAYELCNAAIQHYIDSAALAQPEPISVYRLTKKKDGVWLPASEWMTGYPDPSWNDLAKAQPELWSVQRRVTGKQIAEGFVKAVAQPAKPVEPNNDEVICPNCVHQFRAIPQNVQRLMLDAGFEPPFKAQPEPVDLRQGNCTHFLRALGKPYPRTCQVCGLTGQCRFAAAKGGAL